MKFGRVAADSGQSTGASNRFKARRSTAAYVAHSYPFLAAVIAFRMFASGALSSNVTTP